MSSGSLKSSQRASERPRRRPPPLVSEGQVSPFRQSSMFGHYPFVADPSPCLSLTGFILHTAGRLVNGANLTQTSTEPLSYAFLCVCVVSPEVQKTSMSRFTDDSSIFCKLAARKCEKLPQ